MCVCFIPGIILVCHGDSAHTLADKVHRKGKFEISLHLTWLKISLLKTQGELKMKIQTQYKKVQRNIE